jgi:membrane protein implicated in regulation of membrane protease activity
VGQTARVVEAIGPGKPGRVRFHGTTWRAETFDEPFDVDEEVMVFQKENLTLTVGRPLLDQETGQDE